MPEDIRTPPPPPRKLAPVRFREREELLDFLLEVYAATSETIELDELLLSVGDIIKRVIPHELFAIFLFNDRRKSLKIRYAVGHREEVIKNLELKLNEGIVGAAAALRQPVFVPDVRADERYISVLDAVRSEMCAPMIVRGKVVGVIDLQSTRPSQHSAADLALLSVIAARVASAIDNARLHRRVARNNQALRTLTELSREISSILVLDELLKRIALSMKQLINFDAFSILLVDERKNVLRHRFSQRYDQRLELDNIPVGKGVTGSAAEMRQSMRVDDTRSDPRYIPTHPDIRSELAVPLMVQDKVVGVMDLESERLSYFTEEHVRLLSLLAPQIATAIENARLYEEIRQRELRMQADLEAGRRLQQILLPREAPPIPGLDIAIGFRPARGVSGDIYDFFDHSGEYWMIAFGDSSGKGAAAALYGAMVSGLLRSLAPRRRGPALLMRAINETLLERKVDAQFVTLLVALWDGQSREIIMANAGAVPPIICRQGKILQPRVEGVPLGLLEQQEYEETVFATLPGDVVLFFSDGIDDQTNAEQVPYGQKRLLEFLPKIAAQSAARIVESIETDLERYRGPIEVQDDQTLIAIKVS